MKKFWNGSPKLWLPRCVLEASIGFTLVLTGASVVPATVFGSDAVPIFPEDGSLRSGTWWISADGADSLPGREKLDAALAKHGVRLRVSHFDYTYLQDVLLFDTDGRVMVQVDMSRSGADVLSDLTRGVYESGEGSMAHYSEQDAQAAGLVRRRLRGSLVEGGALITGRLPNGQTYAITPVSSVERTAKYLRLSHSEAREAFAADLGILPENVVELSPTSGHLDLSIQAFSGGVVLVQDPSLTVDFLVEALQDLRSTPAERALIEEMIAKARSDHDSHLQRLFDQNAESLRAKGLRVIRVAGRFSVPQDWRGGRRSFERVNFLNGTVGRGNTDEIFVLTNRAKDLPSLDRLWARKLSEWVSIDETNVYFVGDYSLGGGLDCIGVLSP